MVMMLTINSTIGIVTMSTSTKENMFQSRLLAIFLCFLLYGCNSTSTEFYLFGWGNSCFTSIPLKGCKKIKFYDNVKMSINYEKQTVSYVQKANKLDESNVVFKTLDNCKIIDLENFSCEGLKRVSGKYVKTDIFKDRFITESFLISLNSYLNSELDKSTFDFINENSTLVNFGVCIFVILLMFGINS